MNQDNSPNELNTLENKLRQAFQQLENCKKESSDFIQLASHDLNAPVRRLLVFTDRLSEKLQNEQDEQVQTIIKKIKKTAMAMRSFIDDLTLLSEIGTEDYEFTKCDLNIIVGEVIKQKRTLISEQNADIFFSDLPVIDGSHDLLKILFEKLIDNSIVFRKKDQPPQIRISSQKSEDSKPGSAGIQDTTYQVEIRDNGIGFNQEQSDKIFKPFVRLHGGSYPGNGLGLAICKKIVEQHFGTIYAAGNEITGARFIVILPESITSAHPEQNKSPDNR